MSFYNLIQEKFFSTYEEWHMKDPNYDRNGFHISGIDNTLKAMHDGYIFYTELTPSHGNLSTSSYKRMYKNEV